MMTAWLARFRLLNVRYLLAHRARAVLAVASVALSVALVSGLFATYGSLAASVEKFGGQLAGNAALEVSGRTDSGFDEALLARVAADQDVANAVPMVRTIVTIGERRVVLLGVDQRITALRSSLLHMVDDFPSASRLSIYSVTRTDRNELVSGPGLAAENRLQPGQDVAVSAALGTTSTATLFSTVDVDAARALNGGHWAIANLRTAQRLTGRPDRLDSILVVPRAGVDTAALQRRLLVAVDNRAVVAPPQFRVAQASGASSLMRNMTLFVAAIALAVAGFLIFNTFSMAALERQAELATVRALGARRRPAMRDLLLEATLLGITGWVLGIPLGAAIGRLAIGSLPPLLTESFDARIEFSFPLYVAALALVAAVGAAVVGAWAAAGRVYRIEPIAAMRPPATAEPKTRGVVLLLAAAAATALAMSALLVFPDQRAILAGPLVLIAALTASAAFAGPLTAALARATARARGTGLLTSLAIRRVPRRIWATTMTIAVTVAIGMATHGAFRDVVSVVSAPSLAWSDFYVKPTPPDVLPTDPVLPADLATAVAAVPGVREVVPNQAAYANLGDKRVILAGLSGGNAPAYARASESARAAVRAGTGAIISRGLAQSLALHVGDSLTLPTSVGDRQLPVVDVVDFLSLEAGMVVLSIAQLQQWYQRDGATWLEVQVDPAADRARVRAALEELTRLYPRHLYVVSGAEELHGGEQAAQQAGALALVIQWMVTVAAGLSLLNTLLLSVMERRRELALLRALGASRRFIRRMVALEGLGIAAFGCLLGLVLGAPLQYVVTAGLSRAAAVQVPLHLVSVSLLLVPIAFLVTMLAPILPIRQAGRVNLSLALNEQ